MSTKTDELWHALEAGVTDLIRSERWAAMLTAAGTFHTYSANNQLLIMLQAPDASKVAGFRTWQSLGRQVRKGEKGIKILAPCVTCPTKDPAAETDPPGEQPAERDEPDRNRKDRRPRTMYGVRVAHVFDICQTDGDPLPEVIPDALTGHAPAAMWDALAAHGYRIERGDCHGAYGYASRREMTVRVRADVEAAQAAKTLAHELAHLECGHLEPGREQPCRGRCEIEAESVAYLIAADFGLDTAAYTFPYVARWSGAGNDQDAAGELWAAFAVVSAAHGCIRRALHSTGVGDEPTG